MDFDGDSLVSVGKKTFIFTFFMVIGLIAWTQIIPADYESEFHVSIDSNEIESDYFKTTDTLQVISEMDGADAGNSIYVLNHNTNETLEIQKCEEDVRKTKFLWGGEKYYCLGTIEILEDSTFTIHNNHSDTIHIIDSDQTFWEVVVYTGGTFQNIMRTIALFFLGSVITLSGWGVWLFLLNRDE